jgi:RimJ/RimL family protein N-acetyltransferase
MQWIEDNLTLEGERVILRALKPEDIDTLVLLGRDERIWEFLGQRCNDDACVRSFFEEGLENKAKGIHYPFTVYDKHGNIIGTTRFGEISQRHRKLEIGWTWYLPELWGKGYNEECKYLLMTYCFDTLKTVRVELKTWEKNVRSRRAIQRIGCKFEGILRNHMIRDDGYIRNSAMYSILPQEWEEYKSTLYQIMKSKYAGTYVITETQQQ